MEAMEMIARTPMLELEHPRPARVAVVLNANARGVDAEVIRRIGGAVDRDALFVCSSLDQLSIVARQILARGFDAVMCGGGDGTFARCVSAVHALTHQRETAPAFGVLRLGTGNALAATLGAYPLTAETLPAVLARARHAKPVRLPLLRINDSQLCPFAGIGADALILEDFNAVKRSRLGFLDRGLAGYLVALTTRSLWRLLFGARPHVTIRNEGAPAWRIDPLGRPVGRVVCRGQVLYHGPAILAAASTIPHYGFGLRLFPQAGQLRGRFQLRVMNTGVIAPLLQLPELMRGDLAHERIYDFACTAVSISTRRPAPVQIGGDEAGRRRRTLIQLDEVRAVSLVAPLQRAAGLRLKPATSSAARVRRRSRSRTRP
jgi:diacylglycerol kinase family enzyme